MIKDLINLIFPDLCVLCAGDLAKTEQKVCLQCDYLLPKTWFWDFHDNPLYTSLNGRVRLCHASAFLFFRKKNRVQQLLHLLKYQGDQELGVELGRRFAHHLRSTAVLQDANLLVPVPLHPSKQLLRGFNQSESIVRGISEVLDVNYDTELLRRSIANPSQTRRSRYERWENVDGIFMLSTLRPLTDTHIVLVDDVFTTGATIEACIHALKKVNIRKLSVVTLAYSE
ncbi:MAG: ComF family protein [Bacteroidia bacterium]|nr:ComF family protein [Bacteroidia bacterium]